MNGIEWVCYVERIGWSDTIKVWLVQRTDRGQVYYATVDDKDSHLVVTEVKEGDPVPRPFMEIPRRAWEQIAGAIAKVEPPVKKEVVDAELGATKYHLEDMRRLVFKDKPRIEIAQSSTNPLLKQEER